MIIEGKKIRNEIVGKLKHQVAALSNPVSLALFLPETPDFATTSFVNIKKRIAKEIGVMIGEYTLSSEMTTEQVIEEMECVKKDADGIIAQFPTSAHLDAEKIRNAIPLSHDVD